MSSLNKIKTWIKGFDGIPEEFNIDYTSEIPGNVGLFPNGMVELSRKEDVVGNVTVNNQLNFGVYVNLPKTNIVGNTSELNASWVMKFQKWIQEQSIKRLAPVFGNHDTKKERINAQNGAFFGKVDDEAGLYMVLLTVNYKDYYKEEM